MTNKRPLLYLLCGLALLLTAVPVATADDGDPFFLIKKTIVMSHVPLELPVPDYEFVDVLGNIKNAPGSIACGGTVSEGATADADACRLQAALQFENGYLKTNGTVITPNATVYNGVPSGVVIHGHVGD